MSSAPREHPYQPPSVSTTGHPLGAMILMEDSHQVQMIPRKAKGVLALHQGVDGVSMSNTLRTSTCQPM